MMIVICFDCFFFFISFLTDLVFFFFQAEDGIRDIGVTGVQTCALPIFRPTRARSIPRRRRRAIRTPAPSDRKSTRLNSSHANISYAVFCLKKKNPLPFSHFPPISPLLPVLPVVQLPFFCILLFFNDTATTEIYTLSLHDALPIFEHDAHEAAQAWFAGQPDVVTADLLEDRTSTRLNSSHANNSYAVFCLKKKKIRALDFQLQKKKKKSADNRLHHTSP